MAYAHVNIEDRYEDGSIVRYAPGDEVPESVTGYDELVEYGAIKDEEYNPDDYKPAPPQFVEIEGVRYARQEENRDAE
jgi:hypothetical protein